MDAEKKKAEAERMEEEEIEKIMAEWAEQDALPETYDPDEHHAAPVELCWGTRVGRASRWIFIRCCGALGKVSLENGGKVVRSQKQCTRVSAPAKMHPGNLELLRTSRSAVRKHGSSLPMCRWQCCKLVAIQSWDAYWDWGTECLPKNVVSTGAVIGTRFSPPEQSMSAMV
jgi:hypothetical protein